MWMDITLALTRWDYEQYDHFDDMPITKFFNIVQKEMIRKRERNQRKDQAISQMTSKKSNDPLILFYLSEIMDAL